MAKKPPPKPPMKACKKCGKSPCKCSGKYMAG